MRTSPQTVKVLTDLMFPGDELPGATELGIYNRIARDGGAS